MKEFEEKAAHTLTGAQKLLERSQTPKTRTSDVNLRALMQPPERLLKRSQEEIPTIYTLRNHHSSDRVFNHLKPLPNINTGQFGPTNSRPTKPVMEPKPPKSSAKRKESCSRVKVAMHTFVPRPPTASSSQEDRSRPRKRNSAIITGKKSSTSQLHDISPAQSGTLLSRSTSNTTSKRKPAVNEVKHKSSNSLTVPAIKQKMQPTCTKVTSNFKVKKAVTKDTQRATPVKPVKPAVQKPPTRVSNNDKEFSTSSHLVFKPKTPAPPSSNRKPSNSNVNGFRKRKLASKNSTSPRLS